MSSSLIGIVLCALFKNRKFKFHCDKHVKDENHEFRISHMEFHGKKSFLIEFAEFDIRCEERKVMKIANDAMI